MRTAIFLAGVLLEVLGFTLLALDVLADPAREGFARFLGRMRAWRRSVVRAAQRTRHWVSTRVLRRRRDAQVMPVGMARAGGISPTGSLALMNIPGLESAELMEWLRTRAVETLEKLRALEEAAEKDRVESRRALQELDQRLRAEIATAIEVSEREFRGWRLLGFALALLGVALASGATIF